MVSMAREESRKEAKKRRLTPPQKKQKTKKTKNKPKGRSNMFEGKANI